MGFIAEMASINNSAVRVQKKQKTEIMNSYLKLIPLLSIDISYYNHTIKCIEIPVT